MKYFTHENQKEQSVKIRFYNIVIYPEECHSEKRYFQLFKKVNGNKYSLFQIVNSTFPILMTTIISTFLCGFICQFFHKSEIPFIFSKRIDCFYYLFLSYCFFVLLFY